MHKKELLRFGVTLLFQEGYNAQVYFLQKYPWAVVFL